MVGTDPKIDSYLAPGDIARILQVHPSGPVRWMRRGALLADGSRLFLKHVRLPGGFRVKQEWLDTFLEMLANGKSSNPPTEPTKQVRSAHAERVHADLVENGLI